MPDQTRYADLEALKIFKEEYDIKIDEKLNEKINISQGSENAGKILTIDDSGNIILGNSEVQEATHSSTADTATSAESATKATQDAEGNAIVETYETKSDALAKLAEVKEYTDVSIALKADKTDIVQSDWNQNDETASDFIKNRPFYTTDPQPVELCNGTFEFNNSSGIVDNPSAFYESSAISYDESELVVNKEITIAYDGTTYNNLILTEAIVEYNGQTMPFGLYAGNGAILAEYLTTMFSGMTVPLEDTGEPFVLSLLSGSSAIITKDKASTHDISISVVKPVDITISQKYLGFPVWAGEGKNSIIIGDENGVASGEYTVCEGTGNKAIGACSHAEGYSNEATGNYSHAEGCFNKAIGNYSHAEGQTTKAIGNYSHVEGWGSEASGDYSHAEGYHNIVSGRYQHVQGRYNIEDAEDKYAHIVGNGTSNSSRSNAHTVDWDGNAEYAGDVIANACGGTAPISLVEVNDKVNAGKDWNQNDENSSDYIKNRPFYDEIGEEIVFEQNIPSSSFAINNGMCFTNVNGTKVFSETSTYNVVYDGILYSNIVVHKKGTNNVILGNIDESGMPVFTTYPFAIMWVRVKNIITIVTNDTELTSHDVKIVEVAEIIHELDEKYIPYIVGKKVEGQTFTVSGEDIVAGEGAEIFNDYETNKATGTYAHSEGMYTTAVGNMSHAEGGSNDALGHCSHVEGTANTANGDSSHVEGNNNIASGKNQHVQGKYNIEDTENTYAHIVGNGTHNTERSNAHTLDWDGNAWYAGHVESTAIILKSPNGTRFSITVGDDGVLKSDEITE